MQCVAREKLELGNDHCTRVFYVYFEAVDNADEVMRHLGAPDGWARLGICFERTYTKKMADGTTADVVVHFKDPKYFRGLLIDGEDDPESLSATSMPGCGSKEVPEVYFNTGNWTSVPAPASTMTLENYRKYLVLHEFGHALGFGHVKCPSEGADAPIMMQQTKGPTGGIDGPTCMLGAPHVTTWEINHHFDKIFNKI